ncbi:uncharacterized protein LOC133806605 [Humulus lupulus]|uniref:uncharacterized protein LOC133806605 n=1 Tax=Humulus lupulus TaxID=3486 RepID=UPI002B4172A1|nr:uncharacterized protein LOC133806605 [Humulus lupulus]
MADPGPEERSDSSDSRRPPAPRPNEDLYYNPERCLAKATKCNEELARQAVKAQAPPRRPRGRPRGSTAARREEQATQQDQPRPQRNTRAEATDNPTAELSTWMDNMLAPPVAWNPNSEAGRNNLDPVQASSGPSRPNYGRRPPSPIRHPPSLIRQPSPIREVPRPAPQRPSRSGSRDGSRQARPEQGNKREAIREHRTPQPSGRKISR